MCFFLVLFPDIRSRPLVDYNYQLYEWGDAEAVRKGMLRSRRENHPGRSSVGDERTNSRLPRNKTSKDRRARRDEGPELLCSRNRSRRSDANCSAFAEPVGLSETVDRFHKKMELSCDQRPVRPERDICPEQGRLEKRNRICRLLCAAFASFSATS